MIGRRSSARQAAKAFSPPSSSQSNASPTAGSKRKARSGAQNNPKRGKKGSQKEQITIESSMMPGEHDESSDAHMKDEPAPQDGKEQTIGHGGKSVATGNKAETDRENYASADENGAETARKVEKMTKTEAQDPSLVNSQKEGREPKQNGFDKIMEKEDDKTGETPEGSGSKVEAQDGAVEDSTEREDVVPSSILEKGIIYFFFRGRVGINEPNSVSDVARSYIILRPLPQGAKLGDGPIGDAGKNRLLALPKKVLPISPKDRFLSIVEMTHCNIDEIKERLSSSDHATKTVGVRHTPAAAPIGEGVYAITQTGRDTHLAYILTIPAEIGEVQKEIGLRQRGSYFTSAKNPQSSAPANAQLPQGADYPHDILEEFGGRGWMPLQPKLLDYQNTQFLLIGHKDDALEKAAQPQEGEDQKSNKETALEEIEKLEEEDEHRVRGLEGNHAVFIDLGLSSKEYPKVQTSW